MSKPQKEPSDLRGDAAMALYIIGEKVAGNAGTAIANGISGLLLNRHVGPCHDACEHCQADR